ncbi:hypothetical protein RXV94_03580 [Yeosuana sp. MJ-SS3]|uniref:Lipoprotein n=1 Tax=Gilvirhabdus luticola TaxID=3079858 RepID=A0ABU3U492_9FLAO|nr:hypothetical protein [Yeosuana sp. MJ-SS3]MDU8885227.1 hypothetical protein [Yeosuana sp. MJ-SS3]
MKIIKKQFKLIALILCMLILFQGCTVYKSVPISLEQAVKNESKVRVKTKSNEKFKFNRIGEEDGNFYGVKKTNNVEVKTLLDEEYINTINEKDKTLSTVLSIGIPLVIIGVLGAIVIDTSLGSYGFL